MTAAQLKEDFLQSYDAITNFASPGYENSEISLFLTKGQIRLLQSVLPLIDRTELEKKVVSKLVTPYSTTPVAAAATNLPNGVFVDMPNDVITVMLEYAYFVGALTTMVPVVPITYDKYLLDVNNTFASPYAKLIWRLDIGGNHELISDGTEIASYRMRYIRKPVNIDIDAGITSEINEAFHHDVVEAAVRYALESVHREMKMKQPVQQQDQQEQR